jgi:hypothetical protein
MQEFVSEPIHPCPGTFASSQMATGLPGLPRAFTWRGEKREVLAILHSWKHSSPEGGRPDAEVYLRRHYFRLRMSDDTVWTVYFLRQAPRGGSPKRRWFLYEIERQ